MFWTSAVSAVLIYAGLIAVAMKSAAAPQTTMIPRSSHPTPALISIMSATAGAFGGLCVLLIAQLTSAPLEVREAALSEASAAPLAGLLEPNDEAALTSYLRAPLPQTSISNATSSLPDVETMISRLEVRLETKPTDAKGWKTLAWAYQATGRDDLARSAYAKGLSFNPNDEDLKAAASSSKSAADAN